MILDNLRAHHSKKVTAWVETHSSQLQLFYLPVYSPEYNPDEYLNHDLKQNRSSADSRTFLLLYCFADL